MNFLTLVIECDTKNNAVNRWCCSKRECRQYAPLLADNFLASSRLDYKTIVMFIYCWSKEYTSIKFCEKELNMNHNTTVD
ncbi:Uncharacterized protein FWK35_00031351 [Aphis craccivora]|uniref:Uncharacterized protein n=1 Tax=Aphis craccivora TaxID=307492 RepID=A0A6G0VPS5_APHCR|nr:Uncharacterized protein FWK35_00031351 [Aphis craccivora]